MNLRGILSSCTVVALSFGLGGMAYSQAASSAQPAPAVPGQAHIAPGAAQATSAASLAQRYAGIAALASRPQASRAKAVQVPVFRSAGGQTVRLYNAALQGGTTAANGAFASPLGLHRATAGRPSGARQDAVAPARNDVCSTPGDGCSTNWSGLEEWTNSQTFTGVSADWTVPTVTATSAGPEDSSTWIGIDGDSTFDDTDITPLIQMGTDSPSEGEGPGDIYYEAWYELLPGYEIPLFLVSPGDQMEAVITETSPDVWEMAIADVTAGMAWDYSGISYDSPGFTAEFIQEATTLCPGGSDTCAVSELQDFGSLPFTAMAYVNSGTVQAQTIYMVDDDGNVLDDPVVSGSSMTVSYGPPASDVSLTAVIPSGFDAMAVDTQSGDVFASSASSDVVTEISPSTGVLGSVTVDGAGGIVYDPNNNEIYVAETGGGSPGIYVVNPADISDVSEVAAVADIDTPRDWNSSEIAAGLVYEDGALWTTTTSNNLVKLPLTGTATTFSVATAGGGLVADPSDDMLFSYNATEPPATFEGIDISSPTPTVSIAATEMDGATLDAPLDAAVSPDGTTIVPAAGGSDSNFLGFSTSTLATTGLVYPGGNYPTAVAMTSAAGGLFAGGADNGDGSTSVYVEGLGTPSDTVADDTFGSPAFSVAPGGLAFSPDGTDLYVVTTPISGDSAFNVLPISELSTPGPTAGEGSISGTVTANSSGVDDVCVYAYGVDGSTAGYSAVTSSIGNYDFDDVVAAQYEIEFDPTCSGTLTSTFAIQFHGGADFGSAATVPVAARQNVTGINATLADGATISGQVTDGGGELEGACVAAYSTDGQYVNESTVGPDGTGTDVNGDYSIANLPVDDYVVVFAPGCAETGDALQFYDNQASFPAAATDNPVDVTTSGAAGDRSGIDEELPAQATLSGTVVEPVAGPGNFGGVCVYAYSSNDLTTDVASTETNPDGTYEIDNLPAGTYDVEFDPTCQGELLSDFVPQWSNGVSDPVDGNNDVDATLDEATAAQGSPPSVTTSELASGTVGTPYFAVLQATGGISGWTWTINGLPSDLQASPGGIIFGTPTQAGTVAVSLTATDGSNPPLSDTLDLNIVVSDGGGGGGGGGFGPSPTTTTTTPSTTTTTGSTTATTSVPTTTVPKLPIGSVTATVVATGASISNQSGDAHAHVSVSPGALPAGTKVSISPVTGRGALASEIPAGQSYVVAFSVSWVAPNGTSPTAKPPITMTIVDPAIKAGDTIYLLTPNGLKAVGVAAVNGQATISFTTDPEFVVAAVPRLGGVGAVGAIKGSAIDVKVVCGPAVKCTGSGTLTVGTGKGASARSVVLARGNFAIAAGRTKTISLIRTSAGAKFMKSHKDFATQLEVTLVGGKKSAHQVHLP